MIDCETFQKNEIDALYQELDATDSAAMTAHSATCSSCAARFERLRGTRARVLAVAVEAVPTDFESRIMGAVDAGLANRAVAASPAVAAVPFEQLPSQLASRGPSAAPAAQPEGGAKIFRFMSRPSFAVAATFVLVIGAAAVLMTRGASMSSAPMAASESSPGARAASAEDSVAASAVAQATATATAAIGAAAPAATAAGGSRTTLALNEPATPPPPAAFAKAGAAASKPMARSPADERAFAAAKALATAGRCGEALPKLEALRATVPEAELHAARCIAKTSGCAAAAPRFDSAAANNAGTETGSRATIEGAKCYEENGEIAKARQRLVAAKDEGVLEAEATRELDALDRSGAPAAGAAPHGAGHSSPKTARPSPAPPAAAPPPAPAPVTPGAR